MLKKPKTLLVLLIFSVCLAFVLSLQPTKEVLKRLPGYTELRILAYNLSSPALDPAAAGSGGPATEVRFVDPSGLAKDTVGNIYVSDRHGLIWQIDATGTARVIAGTGRRGRAEPGGLEVEEQKPISALLRASPLTREIDSISPIRSITSFFAFRRTAFLSVSQAMVSSATPVMAGQQPVLHSTDPSTSVLTQRTIYTSSMSGTIVFGKSMNME